jgi:hypothetical protein
VFSAKEETRELRKTNANNPSEKGKKGEQRNVTKDKLT